MRKKSNLIQTLYVDGEPLTGTPDQIAYYLRAGENSVTTQNNATKDTFHKVASVLGEDINANVSGAKHLWRNLVGNLGRSGSKQQR